MERRSSASFWLTASSPPIAARHALDALDAHQPAPDPALPHHVSGGYVVSDTVHPGSNRTSPVEIREATPEMQMNVLEQVAPCLGIKLVSSREPVE
jgi:hypothetical protein